VNLLQLPDSVILSSQSTKKTNVKEKHVPGSAHWTPNTPTAIAGACGHTFNFSHLNPQDPGWTADDLITPWEEERAKLAVPFWIYDGMVGSTNFSAAHAALQQCIEHNEPILELYNNEHTGGELRFFQQLHDHPWRVANSQHAKIIVVPIAMSMVQRGGPSYIYMSMKKYFGNVTPCPAYNATEMFDEVVRGSLFFQRPKDHLWLSLDDTAIFNNQIIPRQQNSMFAFQCTDAPNSFTTMEGCRHHNELVAPFDPTAAHTGGRLGNITYDTRAVKIFYGGKSFTGKDTFGVGHPGYYIRDELFEHLTSMPQRTVLITNDSPGDDISLPECQGVINAAQVATFPANWTNLSCIGRYDNDILQHVEFLICPRGDNPSSPRLYNAMSYGAIPVFLSDGSFLAANPFQCLVPYNHISLNVPEADCFRDCGAALQNATSHFNASMLQRTRELIHHFQKDLIWGMAGSRVAENLLLTAVLRQQDPVIKSCDGCCEDRSYPI
jgi:hypothetical protein